MIKYYVRYFNNKIPLMRIVGTCPPGKIATVRELSLSEERLNEINQDQARTNQTHNLHSEISTNKTKSSSGIETLKDERSTRSQFLTPQEASSRQQVFSKTTKMITVILAAGILLWLTFMKCGIS